MDVERLKHGGSILTDKYFERQLEKIREYAGNWNTKISILIGVVTGFQLMADGNNNYPVTFQAIQSNIPISDQSL